MAHNGEEFKEGERVKVLLDRIARGYGRFGDFREVEATVVDPKAEVPTSWKVLNIFTLGFLKPRFIDVQLEENYPPGSDEGSNEVEKGTTIRIHPTKARLLV